MSKNIVAIATPPGIGGIAVIRLSGDDAFAIADKCFTGKIKLSDAMTHTIHYGTIHSPTIVGQMPPSVPKALPLPSPKRFVQAGLNPPLPKWEIIDTVTASVFRKPNSYTGENVVEIGCHGGMLVANEIVNLLIELGAAPAEPGEFTKHAFLNGRLDLMQAEAVADLIHSVSIPGTQTAARQLIGKFTERLSALRQQLIDLCALLELELDFADEDLEFVEREKIANNLIESINYCRELANSYKSAEILRSGYIVGIAGYPNSGKSTLFNALLRRPRAIVSHIPGTTRDYLEESLFLNGLMVKIIDTAGIRETEDFIEIEGIKFVESVLQQSNMILILNDISVSEEVSNQLLQSISQKYSEAKIVLVQNKIDLLESHTDPERSEGKESIMRHSDPERSEGEDLNEINHTLKSVVDDVSETGFFTPLRSVQNDSSAIILYLSAIVGTGIQQLEDLIEMEARSSTERINDVLINQRHAQLLELAAQDLGTALDSLHAGRENELVSIDIRQGIKRIGELTGESWNEEILESIFSRFCIGK